MRYDKIHFNFGVEGEGYQEIEGGVTQRLTDLDGNTIDGNIDMSYTVVQISAPVPTWGTP